MKVFQHLCLMFTHQVRIDLSFAVQKVIAAVAVTVRYRIAISVVLRAAGSNELLS